MALALNEKVETFIEYRFHGVLMTTHLFSTKGEADYRRHAEDYVRQGYPDVAIVKERVTWRGKNGKQTRTEIDRIQLS